MRTRPKIFLISKHTNRHTDQTQTGNITSGQSGPGSNGNECVAADFPVLQNYSGALGNLWGTWRCVFCRWEILWFVSDSFFLLIPFPCYFLFVCRSCEGIKDRRKMLQPNKKVTKWKITKTEVGNEIEIFITLTKYNTCQRSEEGNRC